MQRKKSNSDKISSESDVAGMRICEISCKGKKQVKKYAALFHIFLNDSFYLPIDSALVNYADANHICNFTPHHPHIPTPHPTP